MSTTLHLGLTKTQSDTFVIDFLDWGILGGNILLKSAPTFLIVARIKEHGTKVFCFLHHCSHACSLENSSILLLRYRFSGVRTYFSRYQCRLDIGSALELSWYSMMTQEPPEYSKLIQHPLHHFANLQDQNMNKCPNFYLAPWQNV